MNTTLIQTETLAKAANDCIDIDEFYADTTSPDYAIEDLVLRLKKGSMVLDLGFGPGRHAPMFHAAGTEYIGVDISKNMVDYASRRHGHCGEFHQAPFSSLGDLFEPSSFDAVWACCSLMFMPSEAIPNVLSDVQKLLLFDGLFVLIVPLYEHSREGIEDSRGRDLYLNNRIPESWISDIEGAGFKIVLAQQRWNIDGALWVVAQKR